MLGGMSSTMPEPADLTERLKKCEFLLKDVKEQCAFVLTQNVGLEARTLATLIIDMIEPENATEND